MPLITLFAFVFLAASLLSLSVRRDPKIWGSLLVAGLLCGELYTHDVFFVSCDVSKTFT
jgi:hypothetical protein